MRKDEPASSTFLVFTDVLILILQLARILVLFSATIDTSQESSPLTPTPTNNSNSNDTITTITAPTTMTSPILPNPNNPWARTLFDSHNNNINHGGGVWETRPSALDLYMPLDRHASPHVQGFDPFAVVPEVDLRFVRRRRRRRYGATQ
jgi:hypothetical protein